MAKWYARMVMRYAALAAKLRGYEKVSREINLEADKLK